MLMPGMCESLDVIRGQSLLQPLSGACLNTFPLMWKTPFARRDDA